MALVKKVLISFEHFQKLKEKAEKYEESQHSEAEAKTGFGLSKEEANLQSSLNYRNTQMGIPNTFTYELKFVPKKYKNDAVEILTVLSQEPSITWNEEGKLKIDEHDYPNSLPKLLPQTFSGIRDNSAGEQAFFSKMKKLKLNKFIHHSAKDSDIPWYYLGNMNS